MDIKEEIVVKKYAQAFLNSFYTESTQIYPILTDLNGFLRSHAQFNFIARLPVTFAPLKIGVLKRLLSPYNLPAPVYKLIQLLIEDQRLFLLPSILDQLAQLYRIKNNIVLVTASSPQALSTKQIEQIITFLYQKKRTEIAIQTKIDPALIAGLRLQSDSFLWEHSIAQQLKRIERLIGHGH
jgi:F-type H+-transporting ATPase subunit delta